MQQEERTNTLIIVLRILFTFALIGTIAFIFHNSMEISTVSSMRSTALMEKINALLAKIHIGSLSENVIRKLAHFLEFALEGFWLMLCLRVYTRHFVRHISWPLLGGMTTALCDETLQVFVEGRSSQIRDVWIDMCGVVFGLLIALLILLIFRTFGAFHEVKQENRRLRKEHEALLKQQRQQRQAQQHRTETAQTMTDTYRTASPANIQINSTEQGRRLE